MNTFEVKVEVDANNMLCIDEEYFLQRENLCTLNFFIKFVMFS